jgi:hypothetical protein
VTGGASSINPIPWVLKSKPSISRRERDRVLAITTSNQSVCGLPNSLLFVAKGKSGAEIWARAASDQQITASSLASREPYPRLIR